MNIDAERLTAELNTLAALTDAEAAVSGTAVTRIVFSPRDLEARAWLRTLGEQAGLAVRVDAIGNMFFRLGGADTTLPAVATGSHIDAIPGAGMYDGTVGVVAGLEALRAISRSGTRPSRSIELILFTSEEPTRFGIGCLGSRLLSGSLPLEQAVALRDSDGSTLDEVRTAAGFSGELAQVALPSHAYHAFVELLIEQGPLLERAGIPLGIVTHIAAPASYTFEVQGAGGHAGAVLMPDRRDALCAAAELILSIERSALATGTIDTVATVGTCVVHPGAVNSVPSRVLLGLDIRDIDPARREQVTGEIRAAAREIEARRGVSISETLRNADEPATCSPQVVAALKDACDAMGSPALHMVSRAYHDTLFMARIAPAGMLFIPCRGGVSHRPDEYASPEDIARGAAALAHTLLALAS